MNLKIIYKIHNITIMKRYILFVNKILKLLMLKNNIQGKMLVLASKNARVWNYGNLKFWLIWGVWLQKPDSQNDLSEARLH